MEAIVLFKVEKENDKNYIRFTGNKKQFSTYQKAIYAVSDADRSWDMGRKQWCFSDTGLLKLKIILGDNDSSIIFDKQLNSSVLPKVRMSKEEIDNIGSSMKLKPFVYQKEVLSYMIENNSMLLVLPCGAGKTPIGIAGYLEKVLKEDKNAVGLIVVKASLKKQWLKEVSKFTDLTANIIQTSSEIENKFWPKILSRQKKIKKNPCEANKIQEEIDSLIKEAQDTFTSQFIGYNFLICNYETLNDETVRKYLKDVNLRYLYADEIHYCKNASSKRSKSLQEFNYIDYKYAATATPIQKDAEDIYGIFKIIEPNLFPKKGKFDANYIKYIYQYGRPKKVGSKNMIELNKEIGPYMVVKSESEVSKFLPELMVVQREFDIEPVQVEMTEKLLQEIEDLQEDIAIRKGKIPEDQILYDPILKELEGKVMARQMFAQELADSEKLLSLSDSNLAKNYITGAKDIKLGMLLDLIEEIIESGEKVCVFSRFERMQHIISDALSKHKTLKKIKVAYVHGALSAEKRYDEVYNKFQAQDEYGILLCSDAGAEGLNLSATKYLIEYEPAVSYAIQTQRRGRITRADSEHKTVYVYQLIALGSYDEIGLKIVEKKRRYDASAIKGIITE